VASVLTLTAEARSFSSGRAGQAEGQLRQHALVPDGPERRAGLDALQQGHERRVGAHGGAAAGVVRERGLHRVPGAEDQRVVVDERGGGRPVRVVLAEQVHGRARVALGGHALGLGLDRTGQLRAVEAAAHEQHPALARLVETASGEDDVVHVALGVEAGLLLQLREPRRAALALGVLAEALVEGAGHEAVDVEAHHEPGVAGEGEALRRERPDGGPRGVEIEGPQGPDHAHADHHQGRENHQTAACHESLRADSRAY
jgi:hypothetical protein